MFQKVVVNDLLNFRFMPISKNVVNSSEKTGGSEKIVRPIKKEQENKNIEPNSRAADVIGINLGRE